MYYRSSSSVVTLHLSGSPSVHHFSGLASYMHWQLSWNFKFHFGFFNGFLLEKCYIKKAFQNEHDGRIMHRLRCSGIFMTCCINRNNSSQSQKEYLNFSLRALQMIVLTLLRKVLTNPVTFKFGGTNFWRNLYGERNGKALNNDNNPIVTHCSVHI